MHNTTDTLFTSERDIFYSGWDSMWHVLVVKATHHPRTCNYVLSSFSACQSPERNVNLYNVVDIILRTTLQNWSFNIAFVSSLHGKNKHDYTKKHQAKHHPYMMLYCIIICQGKCHTQTGDVTIIVRYEVTWYRYRYRN